MVPSKCFFTKGVGVHRDRLGSFEMALRKAGIEKQNLVYVSSIFPPNCTVVSFDDGARQLKPGEITYCVMARIETNEPNRLVAAAIGMAVPRDMHEYGYLSEHHAYGETNQKAGEYAEDLAATMLATTLGIDFDVNSAWHEREQIYKASGKIIRTSNICQSAEGDKHGNWTTVIAAAIFLAPNGDGNGQPADPLHIIRTKLEPRADEIRERAISTIEKSQIHAAERVRGVLSK